jgi:tight adherence protein C
MAIAISIGLAGTVALLYLLVRAALQSRLAQARAQVQASAALYAPVSPLQDAPRLLRWLGFPVHLLEAFITPHVSEPLRLAVSRRLAHADLDAAVTPGEWLALGPVLAAFAVSMACLFTALIHGEAMLIAAVVGLAAVLAPWLWLGERIRRLRFAVLRELPGCLDTLTLALEAGCAFGAALQLTLERAADSPLRRALQRCQQEMRAGRGRRESLERFDQRLAIPAISATVAAIVQAEVTGVSLAPVMRAQALRGTQERFARAEKLAMEAPVKMLAPLVLCIFPCTFIVVGFPIAATLFWGA